MGDKSKGLIGKFTVTRNDGKDVGPDAKHRDCAYFVLDLTHDPLAIPAIETYAYHAEKAGYHELARHLTTIAQAGDLGKAYAELRIVQNPVTPAQRGSEPEARPTMSDEANEELNHRILRAFSYIKHGGKNADAYDFAEAVLELARLGRHPSGAVTPTREQIAQIAYEKLNDPRFEDGQCAAAIADAVLALSARGDTTTSDTEKA